MISPIQTISCVCLNVYHHFPYYPIEIPPFPDTQLRRIDGTNPYYPPMKYPLSPHDL